MGYVNQGIIMSQLVKKYGVIYKITNKISGKSYIGQTIRSINTRWTQHCSNSKFKKTAIGCAIEKYGKENFNIVEVASSFTKEGLDFLEVMFINQETTLVPHGYNLDLGGNGPGRYSEETLQKMRLAKLGKPSHLKGKIYAEKRAYVKRAARATYSEETCRKISMSNMGKILSKEARQKISATKTGVPATWNHCPIIALNVVTGEKIQFKSITHAGIALQCKKNSISNILSGVAKVTRSNWSFSYVDKEVKN